jgi:TolB protein
MLFKSTLRWMSVIALMFVAMQARAQLVIEITRGQANAIPIAIVPLGWSGPVAAPFDVAAVVAADLARSGRFAPLDRRDMIERPTAGQEIRFEDWKYLKSDYIAVGKLVPDGADRFQVQFELYNVLNGQRLLGQRIPSTSAALRATAHRMADMIYQQLTGTPGAFATRIAFLNVEGTPPAQRYKLIVADADGENQQIIADSPEPLMSPAWSPDGQSLAYVSFESKNAAITCKRCARGNAAACRRVPVSTARLRGHPTASNLR